MAKPTKPSRNARPVSKALRAVKKTRGPKAGASAKKAGGLKVAAGAKKTGLSKTPAKKVPMRKAASSPRKRVAAPRTTAKRAAAKPAAVPRASITTPVKPAIPKWVYAFGNGKAEGRSDMRNLLGGKGAGLAEMANLGLPVPPGFTITTEVCTYYYENGKTYPKGLDRQIAAALAQVGRITGKTFGDSDNPLLVSVRSGARASMPGMMDTVLNLGLNDTTVETLAKKSNDRRFAYDSYRRFITMYSDVVLGLGHHHFEEILDDHKDKNGYT